MTLDEKLEHLPLRPGIYQFYAENGDLLYVGKAKKLRNRVRSYFQESRHHDGRIKVMISKIRDLEVIVTDSEAEALMLENTLIKEQQPRYNIMFRDDKSYPYICITKESRPRIYSTRTPIKDGSKYLGPYDHVGHMRRTLETLRGMFGLCTCAISSKTIDKTRGVPKWKSCLDSYVGMCSSELPEDIYRDQIRKVERVLSGRTIELRKELKEEMETASAAMNYEVAAKVRDSIQSLDKFSEKMKLVTGSDVNRDLFALVRDLEIREACGVLFRIREGKLTGKFHRFIRNIEGSTDAEILQSFIEDYYTGQDAEIIPSDIMLSHEIEDAEPLTEYLSTELGKRVTVTVPKIGEKRQLVELALSNSRYQLGQRKLEIEKSEGDRIPTSIRDLKTYLNLSRLPRRIECFDNSNIQGSDPVAAMVQFIDGQPRKSQYKKFHIKTVTGPDDFASMKEIVGRRISGLIQKGEQLPDLIVIDGGKGQLSAALEALNEVGAVDSVEIIGLAKRLEEVFLPGKSDSIIIPKHSASLKLLQRARDEAHRFAITFHRSKRSARTIRTELTDIPGIGAKTAQQLLTTFGSVKTIKETPLETLQKEVGKKVAQSIYDFYSEERLNSEL